MKPHTRRALLLQTAVVVTTYLALLPAVHAKDIAGSSDHPMAKRYEG